jgi:hypothetical protein
VRDSILELVKRHESVDAIGLEATEALERAADREAERERILAETLDEAMAPYRPFGGHADSLGIFVLPPGSTAGPRAGTGLGMAIGTGATGCKGWRGRDIGDFVLWLEDRDGRIPSSHHLGSSFPVSNSNGNLNASKLVVETGSDGFDGDEATLVHVFLSSRRIWEHGQDGDYGTLIASPSTPVLSSPPSPTLGDAQAGSTGGNGNAGRDGIPGSSSLEALRCAFGIGQDVHVATVAEETESVQAGEVCLCSARFLARPRTSFSITISVSSGKFSLPMKKMKLNN